MQVALAPGSLSLSQQCSQPEGPLHTALPLAAPQASGSLVLQGEATGSGKQSVWQLQQSHAVAQMLLLAFPVSGYGPGAKWTCTGIQDPGTAIPVALDELLILPASPFPLFHHRGHEHTFL